LLPLLDGIAEKMPKTMFMRTSIRGNSAYAKVRRLSQAATRYVIEKESMDCTFQLCCP
jgi:hypothetical protein